MKRVKFITILLLTLFLIEFFTPILAQSEGVVSIGEGQLPLTTSLVFYKGNYAIITDFFEEIINNTINPSTNTVLTKFTLYLNSSIVYDNRTFKLPFGITQASGVQINNSIVYYVIAHKGNITFFNVPSILSSLASLLYMTPNVTLYYVYFNGTSLSYTPVIRNANITSVVTNGYSAFVVIKNESSYTLVEINGTKVVDKCVLNITQAIHVCLLAFSSNYVDIAISYFGTPQVGTKGILYNIEVLDLQNKSITKTFTNILSPPTTVYNSNNSFFIITNNNITSLINASGYILANISTPAVGYSYSYMYYNNLLVTISFTSISLSGVTFIVNTYVYMGGKWLKYDSLSFISTSIKQISVPIGVEAYPDQFRLVISQQIINTSTLTTFSYYYYTVPLSKPIKPKFNITIQQEPGTTEVFLYINESNATLLGVNNISVHLNSTLIGTYPPNMKVISFNITKNGTYLITVTASNIFGNTSSSRVATITVEPIPIKTTTTTASTTTTTTTKTNITTSSTTSSISTSSTTSVSTTRSTLTITRQTTIASSNNITNYIIVALVAVVIIAILMFLFRRK